MFWCKYKHSLPFGKADERETGSVETRTSLRGRKPSLSRKDIQNIDCLIQQQPDITINEIIDTLQLHVSDETVRKTILKLGYVYKKKSLHASEQERPRCTANRKFGSNLYRITPQTA